MSNDSTATRRWLRPTWVRSNVVAAEPSAAMRRQMINDGVPAAVRVVGARAEHLPLRAGSVHVAWLSAVLHHLSDVDRCAQEVARVLRTEGVVLVRGLFADLGENPGRPRASK